MTDLQEAKNRIKQAKAKVKHLQKVVAKSEEKANQAQEEFLCDGDDLQDALLELEYTEGRFYYLRFNRHRRGSTKGIK